MYLNHPLVAGFPITLRSGEERDREFLASVFLEVWVGIPETDRSAILSRGYGQIAVDIVTREDLIGLSEAGEGIRLKRWKVDTYPRTALLHLVAREMALKVDDVEFPNFVVRRTEPHRNMERRIITILGRWGYPAKAKMEITPADEVRIRANRAEAAAAKSPDNSQQSKTGKDPANED